MVRDIVGGFTGNLGQLDGYLPLSPDGLYGSDIGVVNDLTNPSSVSRINASRVLRGQQTRIPLSPVSQSFVKQRNAIARERVRESRSGYGKPGFDLARDPSSVGFDIID